MSDQPYIVLRSESPIIPEADSLGTRGRRRAPGMGPETLEIEEGTLTKAERDDLRRDPRTRAIAEPMPMKLIEPTDSEEVGPAAATNETWGVNAVRAPESPFDGDEITVAVLDTGIDPAHPAFRGVELMRRNFTTEDDDDLNGHGTHCAGTIFGKDVDNLRIGVARNVRRALIGKVLGIDAQAGVMSEGTVWTETEVHRDAWYLNYDGTMSAGLALAAAQADLFLLSYLGVDLESRGERVYRWLGGDLTFEGANARAGDVLQFEIINGSSATWGNFGGQGYLRANVATNLADLNQYTPQLSVDNSGVGYAANRVHSLVLKKVRLVTATGQVFEDATARVVHGN